MRLSSTIALLTASAVPRINGNSIVSRVLDHNVTTIQSDQMNNQMELCEIMQNHYAAVNDTDCTATCYGDYAYFQYSCIRATEEEECDNEDEFCQMYVYTSQDISIEQLAIENLYSDDEIMTDVTSWYCSEYTRAPLPFGEIIDTTSCIFIDGMMDFSTFLEDQVFNLETCTAHSGEEQCECYLCGDNFTVDIYCYSLNLQLEQACTPINDVENGVIRFKLIEDHHSGNFCSYDEELFAINIDTDMYGQDTSWRLDMNTRGNYFDLHTRSDGILQGETFYEENICIPKDTCFMFHISDEANDGLCCNHSHGHYSIFLEDEMLKYSIYSHSADYEETVFGSSGKLC